MESFWLALIKAGINGILTGEVVDIINKMVLELMDEDLSNDEKRARVKKVVSPMLSTIGNLVLSTGIAFAVDSARLYVESKEG